MKEEVLLYEWNLYFVSLSTTIVVGSEKYIVMEREILIDRKGVA